MAIKYCLEDLLVANTDGQSDHFVLWMFDDAHFLSLLSINTRIARAFRMNDRLVRILKLFFRTSKTGVLCQQLYMAKHVVHLAFVENVRIHSVFWQQVTAIDCAVSFLNKPLKRGKCLQIIPNMVLLTNLNPTTKAKHTICWTLLCQKISEEQHYHAYVRKENPLWFVRKRSWCIFRLIEIECCVPYDHFNRSALKKLMFAGLAVYKRYGCALLSALSQFVCYFFLHTSQFKNELQTMVIACIRESIANNFILDTSS